MTCESAGVRGSPQLLPMSISATATGCSWRVCWPRSRRRRPPLSPNASSASPSSWPSRASRTVDRIVRLSEEDRITVRESEATIVRQLVARFLAGESSHRCVARYGRRETVRSGGRRTVSLKQMLTSAQIAGLREHNGSIVADAVRKHPVLREPSSEPSLRVPVRAGPRRLWPADGGGCGRCVSCPLSNGGAFTRPTVPASKLCCYFT